MSERLRPVCVIGAGTMGRGIAQVALAAGHDVSLVDPNADQLAAATMDMISRLVRKNPDAEALVSSRLRTATAIADTSPKPDTVVIEAVVEDLAVKHDVFRQATAHFGTNAILASNTSSLSITEIAAGVEQASQVVGMHFFNPVPVMRLVEVVAGIQTDAAVVQIISELGTSWGKTVAHVRSAPGFIVNRVARPFYGEALKLLEEGVATAETIDEVLRSAGGFRMGPFQLMDLIGLDVNFAVTNTVWSANNFDPRFAPSHTQRELVAAGRLGRKSGHGFYRYAAGAEQPPVPVAADSTAPSPLDITLSGDSEYLATLLRRAGITVETRTETEEEAMRIGDLGSVVVTTGRTALEESGRRGEPVLVLDCCLDPDATTAVAFASTDGDLTDAAVALLKRAGIRAFPIADTPALIVARIVAMLANEAAETAQLGVATPRDIDKAMKLGTSYPVGPFEWADRWSARYIVDVLDTLWADYHDPRYRTSRRLRAAVHAEAVEA